MNANEKIQLLEIVKLLYRSCGEAELRQSLRKVAADYIMNFHVDEARTWDLIKAMRELEKNPVEDVRKFAIEMCDEAIRQIREAKQ